MDSYYVFISFVVFSNQGAPRGDEVDLSVFTVERMNTPYTPKRHVLPVIYMLLTYHLLSIIYLLTTSHYQLRTCCFMLLPNSYMLLHVTTQYVHVTSCYYSMRTCYFMLLPITYRLGVSYIVTGIEMPILKLNLVFCF